MLNDTKKIGDVETRVVEERETKNGALAEVSRNFFALDPNTKDVFYFGEETDVYKDGKIVDHEGSWLAGQDGATAGLMMPGTVLLGSRYYQEQAPGKAMDRAVNVSDGETFTTPAGTFKNCLKTEETSAVEKGKEYKLYAPGIGLIQDEDFLLTYHGPAKPINILSVGNDAPKARKYKDVPGKVFLEWYNLPPSSGYRIEYVGKDNNYYIIDYYDLGTGKFMKYRYSLRTPASELPKDFPK